MKILNKYQKPVKNAFKLPIPILKESVPCKPTILFSFGSIRLINLFNVSMQCINKIIIIEREKSKGVVWGVFWWRNISGACAFDFVEYKLSMTNPKSKLLPLTSFHSPSSPSHPEAKSTSIHCLPPHFSSFNLIPPPLSLSLQRASYYCLLQSS